MTWSEISRSNFLGHRFQVPEPNSMWLNPVVFLLRHLGGGGVQNTNPLSPEARTHLSPWIPKVYCPCCSWVPDPFSDQKTFLPLLTILHNLLWHWPNHHCSTTIFPLNMTCWYISQNRATFLIHKNPTPLGFGSNRPSSRIQIRNRILVNFPSLSQM